MYIDKLDEIVHKYNCTYHRTIKMKSFNLKPSLYFEFDKENDKEGPKFKVVDHVRISKYKSIFAKAYIPNRSEELFFIIKVKNAVPWTYIISDLKGAEFVEIFQEKQLQKTNQKEFKAEKIIKRKGDKLHVIWKGYNNSFNICIDKKDIV